MAPPSITGHCHVRGRVVTDRVIVPRRARLGWHSAALSWPCALRCAAAPVPLALHTHRHNFNVVLLLLLRWMSVAPNCGQKRQKGAWSRASSGSHHHHGKQLKKSDQIVPVPKLCATWSRTAAGLGPQPRSPLHGSRQLRITDCCPCNPAALTGPDATVKTPPTVKLPPSRFCSGTFPLHTHSPTHPHTPTPEFKSVGQHQLCSHANAKKRI